MTNSYGIKVSRPGFDVKTAEPNELAFSSAYKTLKVFSSGSGSLTDSSRIVTIPHNLGYVPLFTAYSNLNLQEPSSDYFLLPAGTGINTTNDDIYAYADNTNLYIKAESNYGKKFIYPTTGVDIANTSSIGYFAGWWAVGNTPPTLNSQSGAVRTTNGVGLTHNQSIYKANLNLHIQFRDGSGQINMTVKGISEDDTAAFDVGTEAFSRTLTTASVNSNSTLSAGNNLGIDVTSIVSEVIGRAGWSSGNHMGFVMLDNSTSGTNQYEEDDTFLSNLEIIPNSTIADYKYTIFLNQLE